MVTKIMVESIISGKVLWCPNVTSWTARKKYAKQIYL